MASSQLSQYCRPVVIVLVCAGLLGSTLELLSEAQVTAPLTSSGLNTQVSAPTTVTGGKTQYNITGGTRPDSGPNLFHSFGKFDVPTNNIANFLNDTNTLTTNILSRVTGGSPSNIFGTIQTTGFPGAHLFLINPAGVIFSPTAQLNVEGSFHVSTADHIRLTNGVRFTALPGPQDELLNTAPVASFGFVNSNPAAIAIQGSSLLVPAGQTLSVVGGDITIQGGTLSASGGRVQLASVASPGEAVLFNNFSGANPQGNATLQLDGVTSQGQIRFFNDPAPVFEGNVHTIGSEASFDGTFHITLLAVNDSGKLDAVFPLPGPNYQIPAEQGKLRQGDVSSNLYFTFSRFDLLTGESATFLATVDPPANPITNILGRVVGGQPSELDGPMNWFVGADLYFLNSSGVSLGLNAQIGPDVTGSFHVSTADYLKMSDGTLFIANPIYENSANTDGTTNMTVLSSAFPAAFGFLNPNPAAISIQGSAIQVGEGQTMSLLGGNRTFQMENGDIVLPGVTMTGGSLTSPSGHVHIASVASSGEILLSGLQPAQNVNGESFTSMGMITLASGAALDASDGSGIGGGTVVIRGGRLILDNAFITVNTIGDVNGASPAIALNVTEDITLTNGTIVTTQAFGGGGPGDIVLNTQSFTAIGGSVLSSDNFGSGQGGNIMIQGSQGTDTLAGSVLIGNSSSLLSNTVDGLGGKLSISAQSVVLEEGGTLTARTFGRGQGGDIGINDKGINSQSLSISSGATIVSHTDSADNTASPGGTVRVRSDSVSISGSDTGIFSNSGGSARPGDIVVNANTFSLANGGVLESGSLLQHQGGNVTVTATGSITMSTDSSISSAAFDTDAGQLHLSAPIINIDGSSITASSRDVGRGGDIVVDAGSLSLVNGARLDSSTSGEKAGGTVTIRGLEVAISGPGSGLFTNTEQSGAGGSINVQAGVVTVSDGGTISAASRGSDVAATGGVIEIEAGQVQLANGGTITAKSFGPANAGSVRITVDDSFVSGDSSITTEALQADGGDIHINAGRLIHLTNSDVTSTVGSVDVTTTTGGNIFIDPQFFILDNSTIRANAFAGTGGNIDIVAGVFLVDPLSIIDASSALGVSGTVTIQSPISSLSETLAPLPQAFLRTGALLSSRCVARLGGPASSFVVAGRDAIPMEPGGLLPSPLYSFETASASASSDERAPTPNLHVGTDGLVALNLVGLDGAADCAQ